jgi:hypothetical protein
MKDYKLLQKLPDLDAGAIFKWNPIRKHYECFLRDPEGDDFLRNVERAYLGGTDYDSYIYTRDVVVETVLWFEEIPSPKEFTCWITPEEFKKFNENTGPFEVRSTNDIPDSKRIKITIYD